MRSFGSYDWFVTSELFCSILFFTLFKFLKILKIEKLKIGIVVVFTL